MLSSERFDRILDIVNTKGNVKVFEIVEKLGVSESTIRRDIIQLDKKGLLKKIHGGATSVNKNYLNTESSLNERLSRNLDEKIKIAKFCATLIEDNDTIFIDAGTTTKYIIEYIEAKNILVVTNSIHHAIELSKKKIKTIITGGEIRLLTEATQGPFAIELLSKLHFDKSFLGANGFSLRTGFTTPSPNEAEVKKLVIKQSKKSYILADSSKENIITMTHFANFENVALVTEKLSKEFFDINHLIAD